MAAPGLRTVDGRRARAALAAALLAAAPASAVAPAALEIALPGCAASRELAAEIVEPQRLGESCGADAACWRTALAAARATRDRFRGEYDAHRAYLLDARAAARALGPGILGPLVAEYEQLAEAHPGNPAYRHLFAQLALEGADYRRLLEQLVARFPDYPWAHLSLAFQARAGASEEAHAMARSGLARFMAICPERVAESARGLDLVGDPELVRGHAHRLRGLALERREADALALLWPLSVRAAGSETRDAVRAAVAGELESFAAGGGGDSLAGLRALLRGYEALGDREGRARVEDGLLARAPCGDEASRIRSARFREAHEAPTDGDAAAHEAWRDAALADLEPVLVTCPADEAALGLRVQLLSSAPAGRETELLAAMDRLLELPPRRLDLSPSPEGWAAALYIEHRVRLDQVPGLLDRDLADAGADRQRESAAGVPAAEARYAFRSRENRRLRIGHALASGDPAAARRALDGLLQETAAAPGGGVAPAFPGAARFPDERTELDRLAARVLTAEGRAEEALARLARLLPDPVLGPAVQADARRAWRAARGSEEGYETWAEGLAGGLAATPWHAVDRALPSAPLAEFGGGPWNWAEQRGRTVVVAVWATWCAPCRAALPWLERLAERAAARSDIAVVTVSVDRTNASLLPFLAEQELALPVLTGGDGLLDEGLSGVPVTWIVAPDGRIRRELEGLSGGGEEWLAAAWTELEAVAGPAPSAGDRP